MYELSRRALTGAIALLSMAAAAPAAAQAASGGKPLFDSRASRPVRPQAPEDPAAIRARERLSARLGRQGVVQIDGRTGTPRFVGRLDGFLTAASADDPERIALDYVRAQRGVFGLSDAALGSLRLVRRYSDRAGTTYLTWAQTWRGLVAFDNGLQAAVAADGRLITVSGSPLPDLGTRTDQPDIGASAALANALGDAGRRGLAPRATSRGGPERLTTFSGGHDARLVLFADRPGDVHLAWRVTANAAPGQVYDDVVDAQTGDLLFRRNTVDHAAATVSAYEYGPGLDTQAARAVEVTDGSALRGPYAHVYPDANGDDAPDGEVAAAAGGPPFAWDDPFVDQCTPPALCTWDTATANSWQASVRQDAAQVYYYVNAFHDWLAQPDIGFTAAAGAFEGADALDAEVVDGAATGTGTSAGLPDADHRNNANMTTPADGQRPRMQMYLFTSPARNGGDDASIVYHEYTHGLSGRTITDGSGRDALRSFQSEAMGEGWSDWYAMDYLAARGLATDSPAGGDVNLATYATGGDAHRIRSEGIDCPPNQNTGDCPGRVSTGPGGYTLGDMGAIARSGPEVHADGEIWGQTLWDLRAAVGPEAARRLITGGMRLSPPDPSMLEMRNAILQADEVDSGGARQAAIWQVFADRGMGITAMSFGGDDVNPIESFQARTAGGTVSGQVTDALTGAPVANALVDLASRESGFPGDLRAVTDTNGRYAIAAVPPGTYPMAFVDAPGHTPGVERDVQVPAGGRTFDLALVRDWAASSGGGRVTSFDGPDFGRQGCGPNGLIDLDYTFDSGAWGSTSDGAKRSTVALPATVDVRAFNIDPGPGCGDDASAGTGSYRIETSIDGATFTPVATGRFTAAANGRPNVISAPAGTDGVRFVRYTMLEPQGRGPFDSGADYMDTTELEVYGVPAGFGRAAAQAPSLPPPVVDSGGLAAADRSAPTALLALAPGQRLRSVLARGLKVRVRCDERCSAGLTANLDAKTAKKLGLLSRRSRASSVTVATGSLALGDGQRTATLRFTARARKRLAGVRALKLAITADVADATGNSAVWRITAKVKR